MQSAEKIYKVKVNEFEFSFTQQQVDEVDFIQKSPSHFHLVRKHQSVNAFLTEANDTAKQQTIEIDGEVFGVTIQDELDQMLDRLGFSAVAGKQLREIKAPMPGLVLEVNASEKQQVKKGDKLLILVAMKMENSITIPDDATIKHIKVKPGQAVEKGQVLVELE